MNDRFLSYEIFLTYDAFFELALVEVVLEELFEGVELEESFAGFGSGLLLDEAAAVSLGLLGTVLSLGFEAPYPSLYQPPPFR